MNSTFETQNPLTQLLVSQWDIPRACWPDWGRLTKPEKLHALIDYNKHTGRLNNPRPVPKNPRKPKSPGKLVQMSTLAVSRGLRGPRTAIQVGTSRDGRRVYVIRDGRQARRGYAAEYWEPRVLCGNVTESENASFKPKSDLEET